MDKLMELMFNLLFTYDDSEEFWTKVAKTVQETAVLHPNNTHCYECMVYFIKALEQLSMAKRKEESHE